MCGVVASSNQHNLVGLGKRCRHLRCNLGKSLKHKRENGGVSVLIVGGNNTTHEVNKLMGTLPPAIQALTGVDLTGFDNGAGPGPLDQKARPRTALSSQSKPVE